MAFSHPEFQNRLARILEQVDRMASGRSGGLPGMRQLHMEVWRAMEEWAGSETEELAGKDDARSIAEAVARLHREASGARLVESSSGPRSIILSVVGCPRMQSCRVGTEEAFCPADIMDAAVIQKAMDTPVRLVARKETDRCIHLFEPSWFEGLVIELEDLGGEAIVMVRGDRLLLKHLPTKEHAEVLSRGLLVHEELREREPLETIRRYGNREILSVRLGRTFVSVCLRSRGADQERIRERISQAVLQGV
jgi:hypothetical protein